MNDIRYALRQFRKSPLFTLIAVITLALGIGASTAIFTLLDQALIRTLPVNHPEQLVRLRYTGESPGHTNNYGGDDQDFFSYPMYRDLRDKNSVFSGLMANDEKYVGVQWNDRSEFAEAELISGNYFEVLGLQPALGRLLLPSDDVPNGSPVVVLSFNYWKTKFGSNPDVIGKPLLLNARPFTIVGVVQPGFHSVVAGETPGLFVPASAKNIITPRWQDFEDRAVALDHHRRPAEAGREPAAGPGRPRTAVARHSRRRVEAVRLSLGAHPPPVSRRVAHPTARQRARLLALARPDWHAAADPDGHGRLAGADGVRQHLQPAAGARRRTDPRDGGALCHGRGTLANRAPVAAGRLYCWEPSAARSACCWRPLSAVFLCEWLSPIR